MAGTRTKGARDKREGDKGQRQRKRANKDIGKKRQWAWDKDTRDIFQRTEGKEIRAKMARGNNIRNKGQRKKDSGQGSTDIRNKGQNTGDIGQRNPTGTGIKRRNPAFFWCGTGLR
jgi:hypothetical protein